MKTVQAARFILYFALQISVAASGETFFQAPNTFTTPIGSNPAINPNSADYIARLAGSGFTLQYTTNEWSVPIYRATASTAEKKVRVLGYSYSEIQCDTKTLQVPVPPEARPSGYDAILNGEYRDGHWAIISADRTKAWEMINLGLRMDNGDQGCTPIERDLVVVIGRERDLRGPGVAQPIDSDPNWGGSSRVCSSVSSLQGLVTIKEVQSGRIDHALAFSHGGTTGGRPLGFQEGIYPCKVPGQGGIHDHPWSPLLGMRFQLLPSIGCGNLGLAAGELVICKALQEYGMIYVENGGHYNNAVYLEPSPSDPNHWWCAGLLGNKLNMSMFRVVEPIQPDQPPAVSITSPANGALIQRYDLRRVPGSLCRSGAPKFRYES